MRRLRLILIAALLLTPACGVPTSLHTPQGVTAYRSDEAVKRLGELQNAVIDAQQSGKMPTATARVIVAGISGDVRATPPQTGLLDVLQQTPEGWKATAKASWDALRTRVLSVPAVASYVPILDPLIAALLAQGQ